MEELNLLKLMAKDTEDLNILSACLQDSLVPLKEIQYDKDQSRFILLLNRYKWEDKDSHQKGTRIHSALSFDHVIKAQFTGFNPDQQALFSLLNLCYEAPYIYINFSQKACIRLEVETVKVKLRDADLAWPAQTPIHQ